MTIKVEPGAPERRKLDELRAQIAECHAQLEELDEALIPISEAVQRVMAAIESETGEAAQALSSYRVPGPPDPLSQINAVALLALMDPDGLRKRLAAIFSESERPVGPPLAARAGIRTKLKQTLNDLLMREEVLTLDLEEQDLPIDRNVVPPELLARVWDSRK